MDSFAAHIKPGDPVPESAAYFNATFDAIEAVRSGRLVKPQSQPLRYGEILVRNDSGADRNRYDVLGIDEMLVFNNDGATDPNTPALPDDPLPDVMPISGIVPNEYGRFCVLQQPLKSGDIGRAVYSGTTKVRLGWGVATGTDTDWGDGTDAAKTRYADVIPGECGELRMGLAGAARVIATDVTGDVCVHRYALVEIGAMTQPYYVATLDEDLTASVAAAAHVTAIDGNTVNLKVLMSHQWTSSYGTSKVANSTTLLCVGQPGTKTLLAVGVHGVPIAVSAGGDYNLRISNGSTTLTGWVTDAHP